MEIQVDGLIILIDKADFASLGSPLLGLHKKQDGRYYVVVRGVSRSKGAETKYLHRRLLHPIPAGYVVDHINGNSLDNRRCNLRLVTNTENCYNSSAGSVGASSYPGVSWNSAKKKWRAAFNVSGKHKHIGYFNTELEAAKMCKRMSLILHGEFSIYRRLHKEL